MPMRVPLLVLQSVTVWSSIPAARVVPSGENATAYAYPTGWIAESLLPSSTLHTWTAFAPPESAAASVFPSGEKARELTVPPDTNLRSCSPSLTRQSQITPSSPPEARVWPSGANATVSIALVGPRRVRRSAPSRALDRDTVPSLDVPVAIV